MRVTMLANPDQLHVRRWITFLAERGHELTLVTDPDTLARPEGCTIRLIRLHLLTRPLATSVGQRLLGNEHWKHIHYRRPVKASRPQIVHGFDAWHFGLATLKCGAWPKVLTPSNCDIHRLPGLSKKAGRHLRRVLGGVDRITLPNGAATDYLTERFGVVNTKIQPFSWGIDPEIFRPDLNHSAQSWQKRMDIPLGAPVVLSPRRFHPYWGCELLMKAIPAVLAEAPETIFVILRGHNGSQESFSGARAMACRMGIDPSIRWIDEPLRPTDLATLFNRADLFVTVPRTDGVAQTVLEGMACGCLPIYAEHPAYGNCLRNGENGLALKGYTPAALARAIIDGLANASLRAKARQLNVQHIRQNENWFINACKMESVYRETLNAFNR